MSAIAVVLLLFYFWSDQVDLLPYFWADHCWKIPV
jgi:hypothetical protein